VLLLFCPPSACKTRSSQASSARRGDAAPPRPPGLSGKITSAIFCSRFISSRRRRAEMPWPHAEPTCSQFGGASAFEQPAGDEGFFRGEEAIDRGPVDIGGDARPERDAKPVIAISISMGVARSSKRAHAQCGGRQGNGRTSEAIAHTAAIARVQQTASIVTQGVKPWAVRGSGCVGHEGDKRQRRDQRKDGEPYGERTAAGVLGRRRSASAAAAARRIPCPIAGDEAARG